MIAVIAQPGAPAGLVEAQFGSSDLIQRAVIKNWGDRAIKSYQVGRIEWYSDGRKEVRTADRRSLRTATPKSGVITIAAQGIPADVLQTPNLRAVGVFLASVTFGDGSEWHEDVRALSENTKVEGAPSDSRRGN